jgi:gamma-glutamylcyclotransferase (GGCT)/AIG2-like uncharacterized protein YtfP
VIPDFDPRGYPGPRPPGPVLVHDGAVHPLRVDGPSHAPVRLAAPMPAAGSVPAMAATGELSWSVAYGSNASPGRLVAKGLDRDGAVLLPARITGFVPAFEHRRTGYGSVPLTLVPAAGAVHDTWVLGLPARATDLLDRTEGRVRGAPPTTVRPETGDGRFAPPGTYQLARVGEVAVADRFVLAPGLAYLPGPGARVQVTEDGRWRAWPTWDQAAAGTHVEAPGADRPPPDVEEPVLGGWPDTTLADLPLFVYGTLRPDGPAFDRIAGSVDVLGPATTAGTLFDTGRGWPAASFADPSGGAGATVGTIRGHLVSARGADQAITLFAGADRYEGVPEPFRRTSVLVDGPSGSCWAVSYAWSDGSPPGPRITTGEWVVR